jgi:hypothetical protein
VTRVSVLQVSPKGQPHSIALYDTQGGVEDIFLTQILQSELDSNFRLKGIKSILFLKNGLKTFCRKHYKNQLRSINRELCIAVTLCFPNIIDFMVLENKNLSSDRNRATVIVV